MKRLTILLFALLPFWLSAQTVDEMVKTGISQMDRYLEGAALSTFTKVIEKEPTNYQALWRASLLKSRVGNRIEETDQKTQYFKSAKDLAQRAINANPSDAEGYFVMSVAMGRMALISGSKEKVAASTEIKKNAQTALSIDGKHAGAWHILGKWNYGVANLSFAEKTAANLLFGGIPPGASNENALNCYNQALTFKPNYILYMYDKAECLYTMGKTADCKKVLESAIAQPPLTPDDPTTQAKCKVLLARCQ